MRCSQCGYHSFDSLENCKKCGAFLTKKADLSAASGRAVAPKEHSLLPFKKISSAQLSDEQHESTSPEMGKQRVFPSFLEARDNDGNFITDMDNPSHFPALNEVIDVADSQKPSLLWRRLLATLIDFMVLAALWWAFVMIGAWGIGQPLGAFIHSLSQNLPLRVSYYLIFTGSLLSYFTLLHWSGQTVGKMLLGLNVVQNNGQPLTFAEAMFRSAGGLLSLLCGGWGYFSVLFDDEQRGWNDRIAGTWVVIVDDSTADTPNECIEESKVEEVSR